MRNGVVHSGLSPCTSVNDQDDSSQVLTIKADQDSTPNTVVMINFTNCYMWLLNILNSLCLVPFFSLPVLRTEPSLVHARDIL